MKQSDIDYLNGLWTQHEISAAKTSLAAIERGISDLENQLQAIQDEKRYEKELLSWLMALEGELTDLRQFSDQPKLGYRACLELQNTLKEFPEGHLPDITSREMKKSLATRLEEQRVEYGLQIGLEGQTKVRKSIEVEGLLSTLKTFHFAAEWVQALKTNIGSSFWWMSANVLLALGALSLVLVPRYVSALNRFVDGNMIYSALPLVFATVSGLAVLLLLLRILGRRKLAANIQQLAQNYQQQSPSPQEAIDYQLAKTRLDRAKVNFQNEGAAESYEVSGESKTRREDGLRKLSELQETLAKYLIEPVAPA